MSEVAASQGSGRLRQGAARVRITKITSTCVATDSMNQPVWKSAASALKSASSSSWVCGRGRTGGASATLSARSSNSGAHWVPGRPMIS